MGVGCLSYWALTLVNKSVIRGNGEVFSGCNRECIDLMIVIMFLSVTIVGFQTLGEEYVSVVQVDDSLGQIPATVVYNFMSMGGENL